MRTPLPYSPAQIADLQQLHAAFEAEIVLVGAGALMCFIDFAHRTTQDLDVVIAVEMADVASRMSKLVGWHHDAHQEQRWWSARGLKYDILPAGSAVLASGQIVWPASQSVMSSKGLALALVHHEPTLLTGIFAATPPAVCVLKMIAFLERPHERGRDIGDIAAVARSWRRDDHSLFEEPFVSSGLPFDAGSAFLLGGAIGQLRTPDVAPSFDAFLQHLEQEGSTGRTALFSELDPFDYEEAERKVGILLRALRLGLSSSEVATQSKKAAT